MPQFDVIRGGSASAVRLRLRRGETVKAESDALISKSDGVHLGASTDGQSFLGGLFKGAARSMLTGESFILQTLRCDADEGEALLAASEQGDIEVFRISSANQGQHSGVHDIPAVMITNSAFVCAETSVSINTRIQGIRNSMFSGSGFFLMHCTGSGFLAVSCLGACIRYDLRPGERRQVDNGHLVAWDARMNYQVGMATNSIFGSVASGEGLMCTFTGPGSLWLQTHKDVSDGKSERRKEQKAPPVVLCCVIGLIFLFFLIVFTVIMYNQISSWSGTGVASSRHRRFEF
eukprot:TRINITY_DN52762_c0_g1_i1.p1 TRINITY_DN52762_c0_g1~~TRINITY_DN52762_c0_g1_i1.p1  ORF type:complete len:290 (+),score=53.01 TRINITY_DN52762_c0_g1_i1:64-933(+)